MLYVYTFYSRYLTDWIANTENGLDPSDSVIKRLRFIILIWNLEYLFANMYSIFSLSLNFHKIYDINFTLVTCTLSFLLFFFAFLKSFSVLLFLSIKAISNFH